MTAHELVGYSLLQTSAVTSLLATSNASVFYGLRPIDTTTPCINYYELPGTRRYGMESVQVSINCRADSAATAREIARAVVDLFQGTAGSGVYGTQNGFDVARASLAQDQGLIPETEDRIFNAPVDVTLVYATSTVS